jgi:2-oxoglutarate ferredoxin oxidoreductase subunit beta
VARPVYEDLVHEQVRTSIERKGEGDLRALLHGSDTWTIG